MDFCDCIHPAHSNLPEVKQACHIARYQLVRKERDFCFRARGLGRKYLFRVWDGLGSRALVRRPKTKCSGLRDK